MRRIKAVLFAGTAFTAALVAQSASAADQPPVLRSEPLLAAPSHWEGLYASVSAGGTWLGGNYSSQRNTVGTSTSTSGTIGVPLPTSISTSTGTSAGGFNTTGRDMAAVFTFAMGYNVVYGSWLVGIQSEVSGNLGQVHMRGSGSSRSTSFTTNPLASPPLVPSVSSSFNTSSNENVLHHDWTASELVKIGFLVNQQWLVYGLAGASWGGFAVSGAGLDRQTPFTLWGGTFGGGVERDFGWLRAFVQVKQTNYRSKDVQVPVSSTSSSSSINPAFFSTSTFTSSTTGTETRRLSTDETVITAGITLPINLTGIR